MSKICIRGARTHNLKNLSIDLPRGAMTVLTGVSGAGKSSLAFDTLYAEAERRYVESLSMSARLVMEQAARPDVDSIEGLSPAVAIRQTRSKASPRSSVGSLTEAADYLRLLYARAGEAHCPTHGLPLRADSVSDMVDETLEIAPGQRVMVLAPIEQSGAFDAPEFVRGMIAKGFARFRIDGEVVRGEDWLEDHGGQADWKGRLDVVVDRLRARDDARERLAGDFQLTAELAAGRALLVLMDQNRERVFSMKPACPVCGFSVPPLEPRLFSPNHLDGSCPLCRGTGRTRLPDLRRMTRDPGKSLRDGAIQGWGADHPGRFAQLERAAAILKIDLDEPWRGLSSDIRRALWFGDEATGFAGIRNVTLAEWREADDSVRETAARRAFSEQTCPECEGTGLSMLSRRVFVGSGERTLSMQNAVRLPVGRLLDWVCALRRDSGAEWLRPVVSGLEDRLRCLCELGLGYLSLDRRANSLSGGELQRVRIASQLGSKLAGVLYVLDEPSSGLHPHDADRLLAALRRLVEAGNTLLVVEQNPAVMREADVLVELGPGAGSEGGRIVAEGSPQALAGQSDSSTGRCLLGERLRRRKKRRPVRDAEKLQLFGACGHNLKRVDLEIPIGCLTVMVGLSGSGKSSLVGGTLWPALADRLNGADLDALPFDSIEGDDALSRVVYVDQAPIGRSSRSVPLAYVDAFDAVRAVFAETAEARERGYTAKRFSFNLPGGRCEICRGEGVRRIEMHFLPDANAVCEVCGGRRYNRETLEVRFKGYTIADVLDMTALEAQRLFRAHSLIVRRLQGLVDVGLGYLKLGQNVATLSGGEAQRLKLAAEIARATPSRTLYIFDEPSLGLHMTEVEALMGVFERLVDEGHTVLVVEHNLAIMAEADWLVELGPGVGDAGGVLVAQGTPEMVAKGSTPTARYLREAMGLAIEV